MRGALAFLGRDDRGRRYLHLRLWRLWVDLYRWADRRRCRFGLLSAVALLLAGCPRGHLGEDCRPDGTCFAGLACQHTGTKGSGSRVMECYPPPAAKTCGGDADCFCEACLRRCGDAGVKLCAYSDVSVWGSKPTVCECRADGPRLLRAEK